MTNSESSGGRKSPLFSRWACRSGPALLVVLGLVLAQRASAVERVIFYPIGALTVGTGAQHSRAQSAKSISEWKTGGSVVIGIGPFMMQEAAAGYTPERLNRELAELGCRAVVPVGWDWGAGQLSFPKLAEHLDLPVIVANARSSGDGSSWAGSIRSWVVVTSGAARVLVSSVIHRKTGLWLLPREIQDFLVVDEDLALLDEAARLERVPAELRVLLVERDLRRYGGDYGGLADLLQLAPFFDLVVGLHGSRFIDGREAGGALFIQPGAGNAVSVKVRTTRLGSASILSVTRVPVGKRSPRGQRAEIRGLMREMLQASDCEVALYPDPDVLPLCAVFAQRGLVDGSRLCRMRVPYSRLRQLFHDARLRKGVLWYSEKLPEFNSFERVKSRRKVTIHPRRKITVCTTTRMAASCGGRFPWLRRLALDPRSELELTDIRPGGLLTSTARRVKASDKSE